MRVLYLTYEVAPIFKVGGLGDVAGSLPKALTVLGVDISLLMPGYKCLSLKSSSCGKPFTISFNGSEEIVAVHRAVLPKSNVSLYLIGNSRYLSALAREEIVLQEQFAFFSKAASEWIVHCSKDDRQAFDIVHANDWHTALVPLLLQTRYAVSKDSIPKSLLTIHNIGYQGIASLDILHKIGMSEHTTKFVSLDIRDNTFELLKEGIVHADFVNTVSKVYRDEILHAEKSAGLFDILKAKEGRIVGILNGIDYDVWNPLTDKQLVSNYMASVSKSRKKRKDETNNETIVPYKTGKRINKRAVQKALNLPVIDMPMFSFIGRLDPHQKGIDILMGALENLLPTKDLQMVILGTGDSLWEDRIEKIRHSYPAKIAFIDRFDEQLAHRIYAGADFMIIPSRYEPCGLVQMIAMRYGAIPIVHNTGGLSETVSDGETGFSFNAYSISALEKKIRQALRNYRLDEHGIEEIIAQGFSKDFSWKQSAKEYLALYKRMMSL